MPKEGLGLAQTFAKSDPWYYDNNCRKKFVIINVIALNAIKVSNEIQAIKLNVHILFPLFGEKKNRSDRKSHQWVPAGLHLLTHDFTGKEATLKERELKWVLTASSGLKNNRAGIVSVTSCCI